MSVFGHPDQDADVELLTEAVNVAGHAVTCATFMVNGECDCKHGRTVAALARFATRLDEHGSHLAAIIAYRPCLRFDIAPCTRRAEIAHDDWCPLCRARFDLGLADEFAVLDSALGTGGPRANEN